MKRKIKRKDLLEELANIAFGRPNDAVKLMLGAFSDEPEPMERLDLTLLSEMKRHPNGALEIKLVNRLEALKMLLGELEDKDRETTKAEAFFKAMDAAGSRQTGENE